MELNDLAILNLHVTPMPPIKFRLNMTYCLEGDVPPWQPSKLNQTSVLEQIKFEDFQDSQDTCSCHGGHLGYQNRTILAILILHAFFFLLLFWFCGPFKNISLISSRSFIKGGRKPEDPGKNDLTLRKQNLAFPCDPG